MDKIFNEELMKADIAPRSLSEKIKNGSISAAGDELDRLKAEKRDIQQQIAQRYAPQDGEQGATLADIRGAITEKRASVL
jgi:hypothetical protein